MRGVKSFVLVAAYFFAAFLAGAATAPTPMIVYQARLSSMSGDTDGARQVLKQYRDARGTTPEYVEGLSWVARGELAGKQFAAAEATAGEVRKLALSKLGARRLDAEPSLPTALGASIEVQALSAVASGRRDQAVAFLRQEAEKWHGTSIVARIRKNLNLLTLEGKPAPALETSKFLAGPPPRPLEQHRGHPVLLFFWAHWCSDCKNQIAVIRQLQQTYGPKGLEVVAPTQHYGYVAGGEDAPVDVETNYIKTVYQQFYSGLGNVETPLSEKNFDNYGVSTTPTLALVDGKGIVRMYAPGNVSYEGLSARIESVLRARK
jgi:thiol-disulfide isomerase/thioredoxin